MKELDDNTDFGYQRIAKKDKAYRVAEVFDSVISHYDLMNDLMSFGAHRLWKRYAVHLSGVRQGQFVLDAAAGTADMSALFHKRVGQEGKVMVCDINASMLWEARNKLANLGMLQRINFLQADVEQLPFTHNVFDCVCIAFGLRNVTDKQKAIASMFSCLKYGGCLIILEFSKIASPILEKLYDIYSFNIIPLLGKYIAEDEASYRYLVESIRMHPDQEELAEILRTVGFNKVSYYNMSGGIVVVHRAYKI